jgi:hypothetical protein
MLVYGGCAKTVANTTARVLMFVPLKYKTPAEGEKPMADIAVPLKAPSTVWLSPTRL